MYYRKYQLIEMVVSISWCFSEIFMTKNIVFWSPDEFALEQIMTESSSMNHMG